MKNINKKISERIRQLVEAKKNETRPRKNQQTIANEWDVSKNVLSKACTGRGLTVENALKISKREGVSLDFIYANSDEKNKFYSTFNIINKHLVFNVQKQKLDTRPSSSSLSISEPLVKYLESICELNNCESVPENARKEWQKNIEKDFLEILESGQSFEMREIDIY